MMADTRQRIIRLANRSDADFIAALSRVRVEMGLNWRWRPERVKRMLTDPSTTVIISEEADELSGFAIMTFSEVSAHLNLLAVKSKFAGIGVATTLIEWLIESCRVAGIARINLEVREQNDKAVRFYRRHGFHSVGLHKGYYEGRENALLMSLMLIPEDIEKKRPQ